MTDSGNQIRNKMINRNPLTDAEKHAGLERHIHKTHPDWTVYLQSYMFFTKGEDEFQYVQRYASQEEVETFKIHHPDLYILRPNLGILIVEIDGKIHKIKTKQTQDRCDIYDLNRLSYIRIDEEDLKFTLGVKKSNKLSQEQINTEFDKRLR